MRVKVAFHYQKVMETTAMTFSALPLCAISLPSKVISFDVDFPGCLEAEWNRKALFPCRNHRDPLQARLRQSGKT